MHTKTNHTLSKTYQNFCSMTRSPRTRRLRGKIIVIGRTALRRGGSLAWTGGLWEIIMPVVNDVGCWFVVVVGSGASGFSETVCCEIKEMFLRWDSGLSVRLGVVGRIIIIDVAIANLHKLLATSLWDGLFWLAISRAGGGVSGCGTVHGRWFIKAVHVTLHFI